MVVGRWEEMPEPGAGALGYIAGMDNPKRGLPQNLSLSQLLLAWVAILGCKAVDPGRQVGGTVAPGKMCFW